MCTFCILLLSLCGLSFGFRATPDTQSCGNDHGDFMDDTTRYKLLQYHDGTRTVLALGESPDNKGDFLPPAKNLFKMRWNCALEQKARKRTQGCPATLGGGPKKGWNFYYNTLTASDKQAKYQFLSDAVDAWLAPTDNYALGPNATFTDKRLYSFANMVYEKIYEVGCNYEQCESGGLTKASLMCIYNTNVPLYTKLYEIGSTNQSIAGCAWNNAVCNHLQLPNPEPAICDDLLCKLPYKVQNGFL